MQRDLQALTVRDLIIELTRVEQQIQQTKTFTTCPDATGGQHLAVSPDLIELAEEEQQITAELSIRRGSFRRLRLAEPESEAAGTSTNAVPHSSQVA